MVIKSLFSMDYHTACRSQTDPSTMTFHYRKKAPEWQKAPKDVARSESTDDIFKGDRLTQLESIWA